MGVGVEQAGRPERRQPCGILDRSASHGSAIDATPRIRPLTGLSSYGRPPAALPDWQDGRVPFRPPTRADAETVTAMLIACDIADFGAPDFDVDALLTEWADVDLEHD